MFIPDSENQKQNSKELVNEEIRFPSLLLIGPDGEQLGVMSAKEAQAKANDLNLDLYCVAPNAKPPVCKILDYNKYRYEQRKKEKENRRNQAVTQIKEIKLTCQIGINDLKTKARHGIEFLQQGNRVKVRLYYKGRELSHLEVGQDTWNRFYDLVKDYGDIEKPATQDGRYLVGTIAPKKKK